jgi:hypothetical protein
MPTVSISPALLGVFNKTHHTAYSWVTSGFSRKADENRTLAGLLQRKQWYSLRNNTEEHGSHLLQFFSSQSVHRFECGKTVLISFVR